MVGQDIARLYRSVRAQTVRLCEPLTVEDMGVQPMTDASPPKWHLAHTTWFFETFVLNALAPDYECFHPDFEYLFNSYYNGVGEQFPRNLRGTLSRPTVAEVQSYRRHVDAAMEAALSQPTLDPEIAHRTELGCHHEQQHQELILTDLKYNLGHNPLYPAYREGATQSTPGRVAPHVMVEFEGGVFMIGESGERFCFDNETPRHEVLVKDFALGSRLVTNGEYLDFMSDDGYRRPELWLSEGWTAVQDNNWRAPLYWRSEGQNWRHYSLSGLLPIELEAPVCHVSYFEADAFARWRGCRLATEQEWEVAARQVSGQLIQSGNGRPKDALRPTAALWSGPTTGPALQQMFGDVWQWTSSAYAAYPGYRPLGGTLGEYNGKFMNSQMVLRGGSCTTPDGHSRVSYRNFFYPPDRWQFTGIRIAEDR